MKKNTLKRCLASLLAVLMLVSVTGISPAVFAEDVTTPPVEETVIPQLKSSDTAIEVRITGDMTEAQVIAELNDKLIANLGELSEETVNSLVWRYKDSVYGSYVLGKKSVPILTPREDFPLVGGETIYAAYKPIKTEYTATYEYPALSTQKDGTYTLRLEGVGDITVSKVDKYSGVVKLVENASITYNMDASNMKQQIFDNAIDWGSSTLPAKSTLSINDFKFEYKGLPTVLSDSGISSEDKLENLKGFAPIEGGKGSDIINMLFDYPMMGADEENAQVIRVTFNGSGDYKASEKTVGSLNVMKADVTVTINEPIKIMKAGEKIDASTYVSTDPADPALDIYIVYVGVNTSKQTTVYLQVTGDKETFVNGVNTFLEYLGYPTLNDGMTVGQVKEVLNKALAKVDNKFTEFLVNQALKEYGLTYQNLKDLVNALNEITIADNLLFAIGSPAHAGQYFDVAIAINDNYNTGISSPGSVTVLKNLTGLKLEKNSILGDNNTITVSDAKKLGENNNLCILTKSGDALDSTSVGSIHYWFTGVNKIYAKNTMPTAPGKYIVTATVRGGDFFAMPKTFVFTIVAD